MPALSQTLIFHTTTGTNTVLVDYPNTPEVEGVLSFVSDRVKGDGYFGGSDGFHTVTYNTNQDFIGTATMQATLSSEPVETDWFDIVNTTQIYREFDVRTQANVNFFNFVGNFVWVRGSIQIEAGTVLAVQYNH